MDVFELDYRPLATKQEVLKLAEGSSGPSQGVSLFNYLTVAGWAGPELPMFAVDCDSCNFKEVIMSALEIVAIGLALTRSSTTHVNIGTSTLKKH